jgi:histidine ammonia-lyase
VTNSDSGWGGRMDEPVQGIELAGRALRPEQVSLLASGTTARIEIAPEALARAAEAAKAAERIAARQPVYGRTTGVGANRTQQVEDGDLDHGLRLLRSHAGGIGRTISPTLTRAMLAIRANQLLAGGSGLRPEIIEAIVAALNANALPQIHEYGGLGTADLTANAELGLAVAGERPWVRGTSGGDPGRSNGSTSGIGGGSYGSNGGPAGSNNSNGRTGGDDGRSGSGGGDWSGSDGGSDGGSGSDGRSGNEGDGRSASGSEGEGWSGGGSEGAEGSEHASARLAGPAPVHVTPGDALALMSSSALTVGRACLAWRDASLWVHAAHAVAALTFLSLSGSAEPFAEAVHARRPYPGSIHSAAVLRALLAGQSIKAARIQDPYALRCLPQVHGAAFSALDAVERFLEIEVNVAAENPLVSVADDAIYHHGGFHQAQLTQALDALNQALLSVGQLSLARLDLLFQPEFTGLRPFLADGAPASSGVMILENAAHDALSEVRNAAMPAGLGHATLSRGVEDHSPFTSQSARQTERAAEALRLVLASELVGAVRALRLRGIEATVGTTLGEVYALVDVLDTDTADRSSSADVALAGELLHRLAMVVAAVAAGERSEP